MTGFTLPKILALAAAGSVAVVGVMADAAAPMADEHAGHDHDDHDHEKMSAELMAVGTGYKGYMNTDYIPVDGKDAFAEDLGGVVAATETECAEACEAEAGCNGASYYHDSVAYFGKEGMKNCWLKTFAETCEVPATAIDDPLAILLMKPAADCPMDAEAPMMAPLTMAPVAGAAAPMGAAPVDAAPVDAAEGPVEAGTRDFTVDPSSGAMSVRSAAAALAVAAGAMLAL